MGLTSRRVVVVSVLVLAAACSGHAQQQPWSDWVVIPDHVADGVSMSFRKVGVPDFRMRWQSRYNVEVQLEYSSEVVDLTADRAFPFTGQAFIGAAQLLEDPGDSHSVGGADEYDAFKGGVARWEKARLQIRNFRVTKLRMKTVAPGETVATMYEVWPRNELEELKRQQDAQAQKQQADQQQQAAAQQQQQAAAQKQQADQRRAQAQADLQAKQQEWQRQQDERRQKIADRVRQNSEYYQQVTTDLGNILADILASRTKKDEIDRNRDTQQREIDALDLAGDADDTQVTGAATRLKRAMSAEVAALAEAAKADIDQETWRLLLEQAKKNTQANPVLAAMEIGPRMSLQTAQDNAEKEHAKAQDAHGDVDKAQRALDKATKQAWQAKADKEKADAQAQPADAPQPEGGPIVRPTTQPQGAPTVACPACGTRVAATLKFCTQCGAAMPAASAASPQAVAKCPQCGKQWAAGTKFCLDCGTKLPAADAASPQTLPKCPQCGKQWPAGTKFCADCGTKLPVEGNPADLNNQGEADILAGNYDRGIAAITRAIELDPRYALAYLNRGSAYLVGKQQYDQAIADYSKAIELLPTCGVAYSNRGYAYLKKQQSDQAIADYTKTIELDPKCGSAYYSRAVAHDRSGKADQARTDAVRSKELGNTDDWAGLYKMLGL